MDACSSIISCDVLCLDPVYGIGLLTDCVIGRFKRVQISLGWKPVTFMLEVQKRSKQEKEKKINNKLQQQKYFVKLVCVLEIWVLWFRFPTKYKINSLQKQGHSWVVLLELQRETLRLQHFVSLIHFNGKKLKGTQWIKEPQNGLY